MLAAPQMSTQVGSLPTYQQILIGADASDHSNYGVDQAIAIATIWQATLTGAHVYAAKLHDARFRQMEGGLPPQYQEENELEKQRHIHDDLITKGLSVITDSYLDQAEASCQAHEIAYVRSSLEGKNYTEMTKVANSGNYDLLVLGAQGLGAVPGGRLGTVCSRVCRRSNIDTLIIKNLQRPLPQGPIVAAVDGSPRAYGGLLSALSLAQAWQVPVHVVSAYDPYYHYVAFNRIAKVLSDEAGKVFRFKEQEQLHEDIIDAGLAKIYQGHLEVCQSIANEYQVPITTQLLAGKPHEVIAKVVEERQPSLLIMGKLGIHADDDLDIGGNAEHLLQDVDCAVLLSQRCFTPATEVVAETTTSWTNQANERMQKIPSFVHSMARTAILRYAQQQGHTVITASIVDAATAGMCPVHVDKGSDHDQQPKATDLAPDWSPAARALLNSVTETKTREHYQRRAEKKARQEHSALVEITHLQAFMATPTADTLQPEVTTTKTYHWRADAMARLGRVPAGLMRDTCRQQIEAAAGNASEITLPMVEQQLPGATVIKPSATTSQASGKCPFGHSAKATNTDDQLPWDTEAQARLDKVPSGFMRNLTRQRIEVMAHKMGAAEVTVAVMEAKYEEWNQGSAKPAVSMPWDAASEAKVARIPDFVRGMVIQETERCAQALGQATVTADTLRKASFTWSQEGVFHSASKPDQYQP